MYTIFNVYGPDGTDCNEVRFWYMMIGISETLVWLADGKCDCVKECM
jgi:hypothetical protein